MIEADSDIILEKLAVIRTELVELAYTLEGRRQFEAADVAITTSVRIGELCAELAAAPCETIATDGGGLSTETTRLPFGWESISPPLNGGARTPVGLPSDPRRKPARSAGSTATD